MLHLGRIGIHSGPGCVHNICEQKQKKRIQDENITINLKSLIFFPLGGCVLQSAFWTKMHANQHRGGLIKAEFRGKIKNQDEMLFCCSFKYNYISTLKKKSSMLHFYILLLYNRR